MKFYELYIIFLHSHNQYKSRIRFVIYIYCGNTFTTSMARPPIAVSHQAKGTKTKKVIKKKAKKSKHPPYTKEQLMEAIHKVKSGVPVASAALSSGVPRTTLDNKVS